MRVYVGVPHHLHEEACTAALRGGLHVLVDKPLCNERAEADAILAARDAGIRHPDGRVQLPLPGRVDRGARGASLGADRRLRAMIADTIVEAMSRSRRAGTGMPRPAGGSAATAVAPLLRSDPLAARRLLSATVSCIGRPARGRCRGEHRGDRGTHEVGGVLVSIDIGFARTYDGPSNATTVIQGTGGHLVIDSFDRIADGLVAGGPGDVPTAVRRRLDDARAPHVRGRAAAGGAARPGPRGGRRPGPSTPRSPARKSAG